MTVITKKVFLARRLCPANLRFFLYFLVPWDSKSDAVTEIGIFINVFSEFWSHVVVFWRFVICLGARWFGNVMTFASHLPKWEKKILVNIWQVWKFWFQRGKGRLFFKGSYRQFMEKIEHCIFAVYSITKSCFIEISMH